MSAHYHHQPRRSGRPIAQSQLQAALPEACVNCQASLPYRCAACQTTYEATFEATYQATYQTTRILYADILLLLLAVFLPSLVVFWKRGCGSQLCVSILLDFLGWAPSTIHAWYVVIEPETRGARL